MTANPQHFDRRHTLHDFDLFPPSEYINHPAPPFWAPFSSSSSSFDPCASGPPFSPLEPHDFYDAAPFLFAAGPVLTSSPSISSASQHSVDHPPSILSSTASSAMGSPYAVAAFMSSGPEAWTDVSHHDPGLGDGLYPHQRQHHHQHNPLHAFLTPALLHHELYAPGKMAAADFVDPALIQPYPCALPPVSGLSEPPYLPPPLPHLQSPSPVPSATSSRSFRPSSASGRAGGTSPYRNAASYQPYARQSSSRRLSVSSGHSSPPPHGSQGSPRSGSLDLDGEVREKGRCPNPDCGKIFKDLKAHMLTHQEERPEKCPIATCAYHHKGFARKYDKNRHTLTHYKGTMVCGFCPGSGSAAEKSFNRADVFKRHLTSVHHVEQTAPNARKKASSPAANAKKFSAYSEDTKGKCSTCSTTFNNAQDFYEHLDDCVLRVVQQEEPSEAINQRHMHSLADDRAVKETMERHALPTALDLAHLQASGTHAYAPDHAKEKDDAEGDDDDPWTSSGSTSAPTSSPRARSTTIAQKHSSAGASATKAPSTHPRGVLSHVGGGPSITKNKRGRTGRGLTFSKGGVALLGKGRKRRKNVPLSWGCSAEKMKMRKRVLCVYDGPRRLWKDDMMLENEFEVRLKLADGKSYVTDLDVETLKRAEAFHNATPEEKGPWIQDDINIDDLMA
ncbi:MAG: hypothetical protein M1829_001163 [Trizodia sp. TS-e1964]|nr:MAG: hypothetical protein M1829_001163 [Trizodia sp. TS-e1964]